VVAVVAVLLAPAGQPVSAAPVDDEWTFLKLINDSRQQAGLGPLAMNPQLRDVSRSHAGTMAAAGAIFHRSPLDQGVPNEWQRLGENVGRGGDAQPLHDAFMNSPGHRANIMNGAFNYAGIGVVQSGGLTYVTEIFMQAPPGLPTDSPPACGVAQPEPGNDATFHAMSPSRVLDTRIGLGSNGKVGSVPISPKVVGVAGVPATGVSAVLLNVTVTEPSVPGFLVVHACGTPTPNSSNLNFAAGEDVANLVAASVNSSGRISVVAPNASTHVVADVVGWFGDASSPVGSTFRPVSPSRLLDTRFGDGARPGKVGDKGIIDFQVTGRGGVPSTGVSAVVMNVTVTEPAVPSFLTVWPAGQPRPVASNINFTAGETVPNLVAVKVGDGGRVQVFNNQGATHVVADVVGWFADDDASLGEFHPVSAARILDTRGPIGKLGQGSTLELNVRGVGGVPGSGVTAVVMNVTVTEPTGPSFLTVFPKGVSRPTASNLNYVGGQTVPNLVVVKVGDGGMVNLFNNLGATHVVADVVGWYS
jgi:hypothetical protein